MSILRVNTELMSAGAAKIQNALDDIANLLNLLNNDVNTMLGAWSGDAASAHQKMHEGFADDANTIYTSLTQMRDSLLRTHAIYTGQESEQTSDHTVLTSQVQS